MMRDNPEILVLDLRPPQEFNGETGHIRRRPNIPLERLPFRLLEISALPRGHGPGLLRAPTAAARRGWRSSLASGFENAVLIDGGIDNWIQDGFKTVLPADDRGPAARGADGTAAASGRRPARPDGRAASEPAPTPPPPRLIVCTNDPSVGHAGALNHRTLQGELP